MTTGTAVTATKPDSKNDIRSLITSDSAKKQFAMALPKHLTIDRFVRVALTAFNKTPKLADCTRESLLACLLDCSSLGLEPDGRKAHLIPYGDKCTLIVDYKGLVELARRSGEISDVHADVVCENDFFEYSFGTDGKLVHRPALKARGKAIGAYAFVKLRDGGSSYDVMNVDEIEKVRKISRAANASAWKDHWDEMAKKTIFRRLSKWLPVSSEFMDAIEKDFDTPAFKPELPDMTPTEIPAEPAAAIVPKDAIGPDQARQIVALAEGYKITQTDLVNYIGATFGVEQVSELKPKDLDALLKWIGENRKTK